MTEQQYINYVKRQVVGNLWNLWNWWRGCFNLFASNHTRWHRQSHNSNYFPSLFFHLALWFIFWDSESVCGVVLINFELELLCWITCHSVCPVLCSPIWVFLTKNHHYFWTWKPKYSWLFQIFIPVGPIWLVVCSCTCTYGISLI